MKSLLGGSPLFRKILASILLASVFFLALLTVVVYYSNEIIEDALLARQTDFELANTIELLEQDPEAALPHTASLRIYLASRQNTTPVPAYLLELGAGVHHDLKIDDKAYHVVVASHGADLIYIEYDVTEIERSEELLDLVLLVAWIVMLVGMFFIARILSRRISEPIAQLSQELSRINPDQRGIRLGDRFEGDEVGRIARAFDSYTRKMDDYVQKQIAFAAMASHELRSPLTIVQTSADLIASRHDDPHTRPHLEKIQRASASMANMIHALLAVTRDQPISSGDQRVLLRPLVDEILEVLQSETRAKQITIDNDLAPDIGVEADRTLLTVVLTNLIRNGVKHGEHSSIRIDMKPPVLSIADSGIGIDEETLQHIFDFGYRGADSQGYGVGLYISRLVCDYLGWGLELLPNPGGGIIARVTFPD